MKRSSQTEKEIQIVNLGKSIAAGCQPCTKYHVNKCKETGMSEKEIHNVIKKTEQICYKALEVTISRALKGFYSNHAREILLHLDNYNRHDILIGIAVSYTINSIALFGRFLNSAINMEIGKKEISKIMEISRFINDKAKAHVEILREEVGIENQNTENNNCSPRCGC